MGTQADVMQFGRSIRDFLAQNGQDMNDSVSPTLLFSAVRAVTGQYPQVTLPSGDSSYSTPSAFMDAVAAANQG